MAFTGVCLFVPALPSLTFTHAHSPPLWLDGFRWIQELQTDLRITQFIVKTKTTKLICLVCQWVLGCSWRWSREHGGRGGGKASSRQTSGQLCSWTGSKAEIRTGSHPSIRGWMSLLDWQLHFFFSFCLMFRLHFTSEQEGNSRNEFQFGVANTSGAPKAHEHVSREEMKSNNQELTTPLLWRGRPTLQVTHSEGC